MAGEPRWRRERTIVLPGRTIQMLTAGDAATGPPVIVVGGLGSVASDWDGVVASLGSRVRVVWFDGVRPPADRPPDRDMPVRWTANLLREAGQAAGLAPPWVLVGHSLGGEYAQGFARLFPELTAAVLLVDATVAEGPVARGRFRAGLRALWWRAVRWLAIDCGAAAAFGGSGRRLVVWSNTLHGSDPLPAAEADRIYRDPRRVRSIIDEFAVASAVAAELADLAVQHPLPDRPVGVVVGTRYGRPWCWRDSGWVRKQRRLAAQVNANQYRELNAAHLVMIDRPELVAAAIRDLLAGSEA